MKFLELTKSDGKKVFVNLQNVLYFKFGEYEDSHLTEIMLNGGVSIWVKETPDQILDAIVRFRLWS